MALVGLNPIYFGGGGDFGPFPDAESTLRALLVVCVIVLLVTIGYEVEPQLPAWVSYGPYRTCPW